MAQFLIFPSFRHPLIRKYNSRFLENKPFSQSSTVAGGGPLTCRPLPPRCESLSNPRSSIRDAALSATKPLCLKSWAEILHLGKRRARKMTMLSAEKTFPIFLDVQSRYRCYYTTRDEAPNFVHRRELVNTCFLRALLRDAMDIFPSIVRIL